MPQLRARSTTTLLLSCSVAFSLLTGCGPVLGDPIGAPPQPEDYDRSCTSDEDCVFVYLSESCRCGTATAVNVSELGQVSQDNERETRFEGRCRTSVDCAPAIETTPYCDSSGTCELRADDLSNQEQGLQLTPLQSP